MKLSDVISKENKRTILLACKTILASASLMLLEGIRVTDVLSLLFVVSFWLLFRKEWDYDRREKTVVGVTAAVITFFVFLHGTQVLHDYELTSIGKGICLLTILIGTWLLANHIIAFAYSFLKDKGINVPKSLEIPRRKWLLYWLIMLACQIPFYLCFFPGSVISDSTHQILQAMRHSYSNHHPVVQTWMIQGVLWIVSRFTDSLNALVATYVALQEICVTAIYTYIVYIMYRMKVKKSALIIAYVYFALMPFNVMMSDNMWKDTLFSAAFALLIAVLWKALKEDDLADALLIVLSGFAVCMFRNNGWYAYIASLPFLLVLFWKKKRVVVSLVAVVAISVLFRGPIFKAFNVSSPTIAESLSIPLQQIGNVIVKGGELSPEERLMLEQAIEIDKVEDAYDPRCSDPMKDLLNAKESGRYVTDNKVGFLKLWMNLGIRYPGFYLEAFVNQTEGYYNPDIQRYQYTQGVWATQMPIQNTPLLPDSVCRAIKWYISDWAYKLPALGMLKSIGFYVWIFFGLAGLCIFKRDYKKTIIFLPMALYWGTLIIATPVYAEFRYIYALFLCMPIYLVASISREEKIID